MTIKQNRKHKLRRCRVRLRKDHRRGRVRTKIVCPKCFKQYNSGQQKNHIKRCSRKIRKSYSKSWVEGRKQKCKYCLEYFKYGTIDDHERNHCQHAYFKAKRAERDYRKIDRKNPIYVPLIKIGGSMIVTNPIFTAEHRLTPLLRLSNSYGVVLYKSNITTVERQGFIYSKMMLVLVDDTINPITESQRSEENVWFRGYKCVCSFFYKDNNRLPISACIGDVIRLHRVQNAENNADYMQIFAGQSSAWVLFDSTNTLIPKAQSDKTFTWKEEDNFLLTKTRKFAETFFSELKNILLQPCESEIKSYTKDIFRENISKVAKILPCNLQDISYIENSIKSDCEKICQTAQDDETIADFYTKI